MYFSKTLALLGGALAIVDASPSDHFSHKRFHNKKQIKRGGFSCSNAPQGLSSDACNILSQIGFLGFGKNEGSGDMSVGSNGPNTFTFTNGGNEETTVVGWTMAPGSYVSMDMNVSPAAVTYSLSPGQSVTLSVANGVSGAFSAVYSTTQLVNGQVSETWLEYTTGDWATIDVSREINMAGRSIEATVKGSGCKSNMNTCVFTCNSGNTCGAANSYSLLNCAAGSQNGASAGTFGGQASGGCMGFNNGGHIDVVLNNNGGPIPAATSSKPAPAPTTSAKASPTPPPAPAPVKMLEVVTSSSATPTPSSDPNLMNVVALPGEGTLHELSAAVYKIYGAGNA